MTWPTLKVEIAFASDPLDETPTWVDVSAYVRQNPGVSVQRGRPGEPGQPDNAGVCTFTLSNRDRRFDPTYTAGPYYGQLLARKQVQVTATWSAVDYPVFRGFAAGFPVTGAAMGMDSVVEVMCYDAIGYLANTRLAGDPLLDYLRDDSPYTLMLRQADAASWVNSYNAITAAYNVSVAGFLQHGTTLHPGMQSTSVLFDGTTWVDFIGRIVTAGDGYGAFAFWIKTGTADCLLACEGATTPNGHTLELVGGKVRFSTSSASITSTRPLNDGLPHYVVVAGSTVTAPVTTLYIDGAEDEGTVAGTRPTTYPFIGRIGAGPDAVAGAPFEAATGVVLQDVCYYYDDAAPMTAAIVRDIYDLSRAVAVEAVTTRLARILNEVGWPGNWTDYETAWRSVVSELLYSGQSALTAMQEVERSEQGRAFVARDGIIHFTGRYTRIEWARSSQVQATFSDDGANENYRTFAFNSGVGDIRNDITVTNNVSSSRATDTTSQTEYGTVADTVPTILSTYAQVRDTADGIVYLGKDAAPRFAPMTLTPTDWPTVLGLELGDRIAIESTPMGVGTQAVQAALIDSIGWQISDESGWWFTVAGSPLPVNEFWILGTSLLDTTTIPGF